MAESTDAKKLEAFKALYGLAEGAALKRIYRERTGRDADECPDLAAWARAHPEISFKPTKADIVQPWSVLPTRGCASTGRMTDPTLNRAPIPLLADKSRPSVFATGAQP